MSFKTLNIGVTALMTQKLGLDVTGQNIANASTPGYARQRLATEAVVPSVTSYAAIGNGVQVKNVRHITDNFLEKQVRLAQSGLATLETLQDGYENLEVYFNELTEHDLSSSMDKFWNALADLNNNVEDISTRRTVLEQAKNLADSFHDVDSKIREYRQRQNEEIVDTVGDVNAMLSEIAQLNENIVKMESGGVTGVTANDLRDQRTQRLKDLAEIMDISANEEANGSVIVTQKTRMLVFENQFFELGTDTVASQEILIDEVVFANDNEEVTMENGKLYAMVKIRDEVLLSFKNELDQLAASFAWEFNKIHSQGVGLSGYTDLTGEHAVLDTNVALDQLTYNFTPQANTFEVVNGNFEIIVHDASSGKDTAVNIEVDLDNNNSDLDMILHNPLNPTADNSLISKIQAALDSVEPNVFTASIDLGNRLNIQSNEQNLTFGFGRDTSGVVAALGMNIMFKGYNAQTFDLDDNIDTNPDMFAGAKSFVAGDQSNIQGMLEMRSVGVLSSDTATLDDYYEGIIGRMGIEASRVNSLRETQSDILTRMENQREDLSGVNLDEELTKMILFQRSYQSAARFISTADTLLETLINM